MAFESHFAFFALSFEELIHDLIKTHLRDCIHFAPDSSTSNYKRAGSVSNNRWFVKRKNSFIRKKGIVEKVHLSLKNRKGIEIDLPTL